MSGLTCFSECIRDRSITSASQVRSPRATLTRRIAIARAANSVEHLAEHSQAVERVARVFAGVVQFGSSSPKLKGLEATMLDALRNFIRALGRAEKKHHLGEDDSRLALAALLVHCMAIDGKISDAERGKLRAVLQRNFGLSDADLDTLVDDAVAAEREAVDLYRFTSVLKRQMPEEERIQVVENLWEIAYSDGKSHEFEENLVWRVSELLGVHSRDRMARKRSVAENKPAG
jgi:uncharacterized tellurite resistance protein B-like protein